VTGDRFSPGPPVSSTNKTDHQKITEILDLNKQSTQDWAQLFVWVQQYLNYSPNTGHTGFANRMWSMSPFLVVDTLIKFSVPIPKIFTALSSE
jgi:hypothetical protein